jgi:hypothetical protein
VEHGVGNAVAVYVLEVDGAVRLRGVARELDGRVVDRGDVEGRAAEQGDRDDAFVRELDRIREASANPIRDRIATLSSLASLKVRVDGERGAFRRPDLARGLRGVTLRPRLGNVVVDPKSRNGMTP